MRLVSKKVNRGMWRTSDEPGSSAELKRNQQPLARSLRLSERHTPDNLSRMNLYLRTRNAPVPYEIDADALKYWLSRALAATPGAGGNLSAFLPKNGRKGIIEAATAQCLVKAITAFAMEDSDEADDATTLTASKLFQACRHPPLTISEK